MNLCYRVLAIVLLMAGCFTCCAQENTGVPDLIKQGIALNSQKDYTAAIEKYKAALTTEPDNTQANYQMAFTLFTMGKNTEAVPFIEKATKGGNTKFTAAAYSLMGSIYGGMGQTQKSVAAYQNGIKADTANQRIYYNLGVAYFKGKQYNDAQVSFADAMRRDANDAGSVRMYALAAFHQNKRAEALLGFCRLLTLEPNSPRSSEAFGNLQNILQGGALKAEAGYKPTAAVKAEAATQSKAVTKALAGFATRRYASAADLLTAQLTAVFKIQPTGTKYPFVDYFNQLAQTDNMPAFARYISQSAVPESAKWMKGNPDKIEALQSWLTVNAVNH
jgi:tetratricopeptide (TPR) repeat protein